MEAILPDDVAGALAVARRNAKRIDSRLRVTTGEREHRVMDLTTNGFVIEADGRPPLRGYADIFRGEERVLHGLVQVSWNEDGLVGYEFKRDTVGAKVAPDHVPAIHAGLIESPR